MTEIDQLVEAAEMWLEAGRSEFESKRYPVAFEALRTAAELAAKAILLRATGSFPQSHAVAGPLVQNKLHPEGVNARELHKLLSSFTLGAYGFDKPIHAREVQAALRIAGRMVRACRS